MARIVAQVAVAKERAVGEPCRVDAGTASGGVFPLCLGWQADEGRGAILGGQIGGTLADQPLGIGLAKGNGIEPGEAALRDAVGAVWFGAVTCQGAILALGQFISGDVKELQAKLRISTELLQLTLTSLTRYANTCTIRKQESEMNIHHHRLTAPLV